MFKKIKIKTDEGKQTILNGFRAAGIKDTVRKTQLNSVVDSLNPYLRIYKRTASLYFVNLYNV